MNEQFNGFIKEDFPIFYMNKHQKEKNKKQNAIDVALENNQVRAVNIIIEHIVKF